MIRFLLFISLVGCVGNRALRKDFTSLSESPCVDGTILNIYESGCINTYVGVIENEFTTIKIRCTYSNRETSWTRSSFYVVKRGTAPQEQGWQRHCSDRYVDVYTVDQMDN